MEFTKNKGIIIVESDPFYRSLLLSILSSLGIHDLYSYVDFNDAYNNKQEHTQCSLMFINYDKNKINFHNTFSQTNTWSPNVKIVFISANEDLDLVTGTPNAVAFDYIIKNDDIKYRIIRLLNKLNYFD